MGKIKAHSELLIQYIMSVVGGIIGGYAIFLRGGNFASAQTANLIDVIISTVTGKDDEIMIRIGSFLIYSLTIVFSCIITHLLKRKMIQFCIILEIVVIISCGFIPLDVNPIIALYPVFAITALQWCTFNGAKGCQCSTIFSTNNLRQTITSIIEYKRTKSHLWKERFFVFGGSLFSFYIGVSIGVLATILFSVSGIWVCLIPLGISFYLSKI